MRNWRPWMKRCTLYHIVCSIVVSIKCQSIKSIRLIKFYSFYCFCLIFIGLWKFFFLEHGADIKCTHVQMQHNIVEVYKVNMTAYLTFWVMSISIFDDLSIKCEARTWNFIFDPNCIPINLPYPNDHCAQWMINKLYYMLYTSVRIFQIQFLACNKTDSHDKLDSVNEEKTLAHNKVSH